MNDFFVFESNKFYVYKKCISLIKEICDNIKFLCLRNNDIDKIQSFLGNYNRIPVTKNDNNINEFFTYDIYLYY